MTKLADFQIALVWMLDFEDPHRLYATVPDKGGYAISGINSAAFPQQFAAINAMTHADRIPAVAAFYQKNFWNQWLAQLESDEIAKRVFDASVNMGAETAVKLLQFAMLNAGSSFQSQLKVDGIWGPITVAAANAWSDDTLVAPFQEARVNHYRDIVAANPADAIYLAPWTARAMC
jgi:lysozyme family protein